MSKWLRFALLIDPSLCRQVALSFGEGRLLDVDAFSDDLLDPCSRLGSRCNRAKKAAREATSAGIETASLFDRRAWMGLSQAESSSA